MLRCRHKAEDHSNIFDETQLAMSKSMLTDNEFDTILAQFPGIDFGFAYGSGVVKQQGYDYSADSSLAVAPTAEEMRDHADLPMVDMIFVVEDPVTWHRKNMTLNPGHYTAFISASPEIIFKIQDRFGAGMWYNAMIAMNLKRYPTRLMKYGIIGRQR